MQLKAGPAKQILFCSSTLQWTELWLIFFPANQGVLCSDISSDDLTYFQAVEQGWGRDQGVFHV